MTFKHISIPALLLAAAGAFALTMGTRQTMGFFLSPLNTATGLGSHNMALGSNPVVLTVTDVNGNTSSQQ